MTLLKPTLLDRLEMYVPVKLSWMLTVIVFIGNWIIQGLVMFIYYRFTIFQRLVPRFFKHRDDKIPLKQVVSVPGEFRKHLEQHLHPDLQKKYHFLIERELASSISQSTTPNLSRATRQGTLQAHASSTNGIPKLQEKPNALRTKFVLSSNASNDSGESNLNHFLLPWYMQMIFTKLSLLIFIFLSRMWTQWLVKYLFLNNFLP